MDSPHASAAWDAMMEQGGSWGRAATPHTQLLAGTSCPQGLPGTREHLMPQLAPALPSPAPTVLPEPECMVLV